MLGIGFSEMVLIAGLALVVIGPEKFPDFAKLVIRTVRDLRGYVDDVKSEVTKELTPLKKEVDSLSRIDPEKYIDSLTSGDVDDNPSINDEDRKVMGGGATATTTTVTTPTVGRKVRTATTRPTRARTRRKPWATARRPPRTKPRRRKRPRRSARPMRRGNTPKIPTVPWVRPKTILTLKTAGSN